MKIRNRFNSVALSHRLCGLIPSFLLPKKEEQSNPCSFIFGARLRAKPTKFIPEGKIFIHGLERTGTGYCTNLLRNNIRNVEVLDGSKHHFFTAGLNFYKSFGHTLKVFDWDGSKNSFFMNVRHNNFCFLRFFPTFIRV